MTKAEEWLYGETLRGKQIAVLHFSWPFQSRVAIARVISATLPVAGEGNATYRVLGSGRSFTMAYNDARRRGNIRRKV